MYWWAQLFILASLLSVPIFKSYTTYNSVSMQTIYYLGRPHSSIPQNPVVGAAAWKASDLRSGSSKVSFSVTNAHVEEIERALESVTVQKIPLQSLTKDHMPLPLLSPEIEKWKAALTNGIGVQLIKGLPVSRWTDYQREVFFWCLGLHMGTPGAQNTAGELLGHVRDVGGDYSKVRGYLTNSYLKYHCDASDVVGLMCINKAKDGGTSRLVSSVSIFNEIQRQRPDLVPLMFQDQYLDTKGSHVAGWVPVTPAQYYNRSLSTFWHSDYYRTSRTDYNDSIPITPQEEELFQLFDKIASDPEFHYDMDLQPGDIQFISNHVVVHARTGYEDYPEFEKRRHLLRLWLTLDKDNESWQTTLRRWLGIAGVVGKLGRRFVEYQLS